MCANITWRRRRNGHRRCTAQYSLRRLGSGQPGYVLCLGKVEKLTAGTGE